MCRYVFPHHILTMIELSRQMQTAMSLISANLLVVGAAGYAYIEGWVTKRRAQATPHSPPAQSYNSNAQEITYDIELTRISTSDGFSTDPDEGLRNGAENTLHRETRPLFLSVWEVGRRDEYCEVSEDRRRTV